jgi:NAD(P)-dependent dehydrogenase (short-subunit alcohol dehydrogenase family)
MPEYRSYVVTGGAQGIGRAIASRLTADGYVIVIDVAGDLGWAHERVRLVSGNAGDPQVAAEAAQLAESAGPLAGWVNNAAIFQDGGLDTMSAPEILGLISANLALAVTGCHVAVNHYLSHGRPGSHRQRLLSPGPAAGPRSTAVRHRQGRRRRPDPRCGCGPRATRHPH